MKKRIITGIIALVMPVAVMFFVDSPLLGILCVLFSGMASYEICHAVRMKNTAMIAIATAVGAMVPAILEYRLFELLRVPPWFPLLVYVFVLVVLMLAQFEKTRFEHVLYALLASLAVPAAVSVLTVIRDFIKEREGAAYDKNLAVYFLFFTFCCAWLSDAFAYFVGSKLGKHKLCPKISPKKTWEGAIGGVLLTALANTGFAALFNAFFLKSHQLNLLAIGLISIPVCVVAIFGDLSASTLKRSYDVKDFGRFFPGHGGVMDRMDSISYAAPFVYTLLQFESSMNISIFYR